LPFSVSDSVFGLAGLASSAGLFGLVCSQLEISGIRAKFPALALVVPGVRPAGADKQDQARTLTPSEAARAGALALVVGRPITQASVPRLAAQGILKEIGRLK
jgi:orotidine-5'-phosphate decarboxylase